MMDTNSDISGASPPLKPPGMLQKNTRTLAASRAETSIKWHSKTPSQPARDDRFRSLLGERQWHKLPHPIRKRFSKSLKAGEWALYRGFVDYTKYSRTGWLLAQLCRLIGAPLPICGAPNTPALVAVCDTPGKTAQIWTRIYGRPDNFHQVIHSKKRFAGPTGLEEYVGYGVGMALTVEVVDEAMVFRSAHYFLQVFNQRFRLPQFLTPGRMEIVHREEGGGRFSFTLNLNHPWAGLLVSQRAIFEEVKQ